MGAHPSPFELAGLTALMAATRGRPEVTVAVIDGPVDTGHPDLSALLRTVGPAASCRVGRSEACRHGTFVAGMLAGRRNSPAPALCPGCRFLVRPVFCEVSRPGTPCPSADPGELAEALHEVTAVGAKVINLSVGVARGTFLDDPAIRQAFESAQRRGVLVVAASGNAGQLGTTPLLAHPWVLSVAACDRVGRLLAISNLGPGIGRRGLTAPGEGVRGTAPGGGYQVLTGTSVAAPFVTGAAALLWSLYPRASAAVIRRALLGSARRRSVTPPRLDGLASWRRLAASSMKA